MKEKTTGWYIEQIFKKIPDVIQVLRDILAALGGAENAEAWDCGEMHLTTNEPQQLPPVVIPNGMQIAVNALKGNVNSVYVANSKENVVIPDRRRTLANESGVALRIKRSDMVWVVGTAGDGVGWVTEVEL